MEIFSSDVNVLVTLPKEDLVSEAQLRFLPSNGAKNDLALILATDNATRQANGTLTILQEHHHRKDTCTVSSAQPAPPQTLPLPQTMDDLIRLLQAVTTVQIVQIVSSQDAVRAIPKFSGSPTESAQNWIRNVERVMESAHWSPELTVLHVSTRLTSQALYWHQVQGQNFPSWPAWRDAFAKRFHSRMTPTEFISHISTRTLLPTETLTAYIFEKNAMLELSPFPLTSQDRVAMILADIRDSACAYALATPPCTDVDMLLDRAHHLDSLRRIKTPSVRSHDVPTAAVQSTAVAVNATPASAHPSNSDSSSPRRDAHPKYNPHLHNAVDMVCYRCGANGHVSYDCTSKPAPPGKQPLHVQPYAGSTASASPPIVTTPSPSTPVQRLQKPSPSSTPSVNCVAPSPHNLALVPVTINNGITVDALPDSGSQLTLLRSSLVPSTATVYPWISGALQVAGGTVTPSGWFTASLRIGKLQHVMPRVALVDPLPVAMLLGRDWQFEVQARILYEPNGALCIMTPTTRDTFECVTMTNAAVGCVVRSQYRSAPALHADCSSSSCIASVSASCEVISAPTFANDVSDDAAPSDISTPAVTSAILSQSPQTALTLFPEDFAYFATPDDSLPCSDLPGNLDTAQQTAFEDFTPIPTSPPPPVETAASYSPLGACPQPAQFAPGIVVSIAALSTPDKPQVFVPDLCLHRSHPPLDDPGPLDGTSTADTPLHVPSSTSASVPVLSVDRQDAAMLPGPMYLPSRYPMRRRHIPLRFREPP